MTRRDRFTEIEDLIERMGREFEELGGTLDAPGPGVPGFPDTREIAVDVIEDDETITVLADLPGFDADGIEVELHDETLSITATHDETRDTEVTVDEDDATADDAVEGDAAEGADTGGDDSSEAGGGDDVRYHRRERRRRAVSRRIPIPEPVDRDGATASYDDGVLTVTLPKRSSDDAGHNIDVS
ncbi:Hsp20/alpha crystallin family protein [Halorubrum lacusprofundi]|jgi:HSP20 family protein|uniref:Heat shock protein Hsp20 n=1 Tax=Halorubrum lacusprofundi (strain ATCC 49239 / DSM 5036 / JCM 8891 / ACAM 34) TaxID=416348 RepID=B9LSA4_HALLT|nr:Hsp20/alpha crystallin family protein [Halorubrum lacusprofundi]ACM55949.1 heat shock protein Hsp20 [Halorubrum lacusprofundi ATCC 49239]